MTGAIKSVWSHDSSLKQILKRVKAVLESEKSIFDPTYFDYTLLDPRVPNPVVHLPGGTRKPLQDITVRDMWHLFSYCATYCRDCDFSSESVWRAIGHMIKHPRHRIQECW